MDIIIPRAVNREGLVSITDIIRGWKTRRRERQRERDLNRVRAQLERRGVSVNHLTDEDLEAVIANGRQVLDNAHIPGGDTTGAFVVVVRDRENI
jgi:hypothetical protein